jgi:hypothetical protein
VSDEGIVKFADFGASKRLENVPERHDAESTSRGTHISRQ